MVCIGRDINDYQVPATWRDTSYALNTFRDGHPQLLCAELNRNIYHTHFPFFNTISVN